MNKVNTFIRRIYYFNITLLLIEIRKIGRNEIQLSDFNSLYDLITRYGVVHSY